MSTVPTDEPTSFFGPGTTCANVCKELNNHTAGTRSLRTFLAGIRKVRYGRRRFMFRCAGSDETKVRVASSYIGGRKAMEPVYG